MKSRTLSCNKTAFKKDISRFLPLWALYTLLLLVVLVVVSGEKRYARDIYYFLTTMEDTVKVMTVVNLFYAPVCALLLFGDLYDSRLCNALHALPLRRESWFATHVASGLLFSLAPNVLFALMVLPLLEGGWLLSPVWLAVVTLEFICFFGIAVFSAQCVGNRFAMLVVYAIVNFAVFLAVGAVELIYKPLLEGVALDFEWALWGIPVAALMADEYVLIQSVFIDGVGRRFLELQLGKDLWIPVVYAAVGVAFGAAALALYRKRRLEAAGDFLAFPVLEKPFLVFFSVCAGLACHIFFTAMMGLQSVWYFFLVIGVVVGYLACQMLLKRTTRVLRLRALAEMAAVTAALLLSLWVTALDPLGITRWVPELNEVESITVYDGYETTGAYNEHFILTDPAEVQSILELHAHCVAQLDDDGLLEFAQTEPFTAAVTVYDSRFADTVEVSPTLSFTLQYRLTNGRTVVRFYRAYATGQWGQLLEGYYSRPECVFNLELKDLPNLEQLVWSIMDENAPELTAIHGETKNELLRAILADCEAGTMAQPWEFHEDENAQYWLGLEYLTESRSITRGESIRIYESNVNTYAWLQEHGLLSHDQRYELEE